MEALVVGRGAIASRLGYAHGDVGGPWLLTLLFSALSRDARIVPVPSVADLGPPIVLAVRSSTLSHPRDET